MALYRTAFEALPNRPSRIEVAPDSPSLHVARQRTASGWAWVVNAVGDDAPARIALPTPAGEVSLRVRPWWPQVVMVSDDGRLLMAVVDGELAIDGRAVISEGPLVGLASLDGRDLRDSAAVLFCPFGSGSVKSELRGSLEWGEWQDGRWTPLEHASLGNGSFGIDADQATCAALICRTDPQRWRKRLTRLVAEPWTIPGY